MSAVYSADLLDAVASPTTSIREGLLVGFLTSSGELEEWDADATDGTEQLAGIVPTEFQTLDYAGATQDRVLDVLVSAPLKASQLLIEGAAFVGHANEYAARRALHASGSRLDDDPLGYLAGGITRFATVSGTTDTLTASQTGTMITYSNAASVTVTLPDPLLGLEYWLIRTGDEEFVITSTSLDDIIGPNNDCNVGRLRNN
jgi:hypothetical protein